MPSLNPDGLAAAMEAAMPQAWQDVKNTPFAGGDPNDRKPLFLAISRAVLKYLHDNQSGLIKTMDLSVEGVATPVANTVTNVTLDITGV
jgi:hypothetical protein